MNPALTGLLGVSLADEATGLAAPVVKAVAGDPYREELMDQHQFLRDTQAMAIRYDGMRRSQAENVQMLMRYNPHLYNEVLAGERLATGTVVFGGQPRMDLMDMLAQKMSLGQVGRPDSAVQALNERLL